MIPDDKVFFLLHSLRGNLFSFSCGCCGCCFFRRQLEERPVIRIHVHAARACILGLLCLLLALLLLLSFLPILRGLRVSFRKARGALLLEFSVLTFLIPVRVHLFQPFQLVCSPFSVHMEEVTPGTSTGPPSLLNLVKHNPVVNFLHLVGVLLRDREHVASGNHNDIDRAGRDWTLYSPFRRFFLLLHISTGCVLLML